MLPQGRPIICVPVGGPRCCEDGYHLADSYDAEKPADRRQKYKNNPLVRFSVTFDATLRMKECDTMRILVVEDDRLLNNTLCYNLDTAGYVDSALTNQQPATF